MRNWWIKPPSLSPACREGCGIGDGEWCRKNDCFLFRKLTPMAPQTGDPDPGTTRDQSPSDAFGRHRQGPSWASLTRPTTNPQKSENKAGFEWEPDAFMDLDDLLKELWSVIRKPKYRWTIRVWRSFGVFVLGWVVVAAIPGIPIIWLAPAFGLAYWLYVASRPT